GANEDNAASGDLDLRHNVTIKGKGASASIIDASALDRVFHVLAGKVMISGVTIQHGRADEGGGLLNSGGQVTLTSVVIANNQAVASSGAAGADDPVGRTRTDSTGGAGGNGTAGGVAMGGGISNERGSLTIAKSSLLSNQVHGGAGGQGGG